MKECVELPHDSRIDSAFLPRQYRNVLICFTAEYSMRPDATRNFSKHLRHRGQLSDVLKLNSGGVEVGWLPLPRLTYNHCCHYVGLLSDQINSTANTGSVVFTYTGTLIIDNAITTCICSLKIVQSNSPVRTQPRVNYFPFWPKISIRYFSIIPFAPYYSQNYISSRSSHSSLCLFWVIPSSLRQQS